MRLWMTSCAVFLLACGGSKETPPSQAPAPAPAPTAAPAPIVKLHVPSPAPPSQLRVRKKVKIAETIQPVKLDRPVEHPDDGGGSPFEEEGGVEGGEVGGVVGGVVSEAPPPPPPPPRPTAQYVTPAALEAQRISGDKHIVPDAAVVNAIRASGRSRMVTPFKVCVGKDGRVSTAKVLKTSGYPAYDDKILTAIRAWRFRPFMVNGAAVEACAAFTFIYTQTN